MGSGTFGGEPVPELGEGPCLIASGQRVPGDEGTVYHRAVGIGVVGEQRSPEVSSVLAETLHVHVDLDVGAADLRAIDATYQRDVPQPRNGIHDRVVESRAARPTIGDRTVVPGKLIDGGDPRRHQRLALVARRHQAHVTPLGEFRPAPCPPQTRPAFGHPSRDGGYPLRRNLFASFCDLCVVVEHRPDGQHDDAVGIHPDHATHQVVGVGAHRQAQFDEHRGQMRQP